MRIQASMNSMSTRPMRATCAGLARQAVSARESVGGSPASMARLMS
jgi:hypothetical protein